MMIKILLIIMVGLFVYSNGLNGKFLWDDEFLIVNNNSVKSWAEVPKIFVKDVGIGNGESYIYYRPLQLFSYVIDYSIWKLNPFGYHLTSVLLHILAALALYWLVNILWGDVVLSLFTSLLFLIHPIQTEAVMYISGRTDPLVVLFMLLCLIFYVKGLSWAMVLSYILAFLSKESALVLPLLILVYHYAFRKKVDLRRFSLILGVVFAYLLFRLTFLRTSLPSSLYFASAFRRIPGFFVAISNYIKLMLLPFDLHMGYGNILFGFREPRAVAGVIILAFFIWYAVKKRAKGPLITFSIFWFFASLLPASNIYPLPFYMAEHYAYLASIGFFLVLAAGLVSLYRHKTFKAVSVFLMASLTLFYSYLTIRQNNYWIEPIGFYERILKYEPDNAVIQYNLGTTYYKMGERDKGVALLKKAIESNPNFAQAYHNLAVAYFNEKDYKSAILCCDKAKEMGFINEALLELLKPYRDKY